MKLWSDEDRLFIPRVGGWTINFKHIARKLGWVKKAPLAGPSKASPTESRQPETREDRMRRSVERSRFEDN